MLLRMVVFILKDVENLYILFFLLFFNLILKWFGVYIGYIFVKFGMMMVIFGFVVEFVCDGIVVNMLWLCIMIVIVVV